MQLRCESGFVIPVASEDNIQQRLASELFFSLMSDTDSYVQACLKLPWPSYGSRDFKLIRPHRGPIRKIPKLPNTSRIRPTPEYFLEYQNGSLAEHYQATRRMTASDRRITLEHVRICFSKYVLRDESWRTDFEWEKMSLADLGLETLE